MPAMRQEQLDQLRCGNPECDHTNCFELYLHSACHPKAGLQVMYSKLDGTMTVSCAECDATVVVFQVSSEAAEEALIAIK
jgi:hypothetical protein